MPVGVAAGHGHPEPVAGLHDRIKSGDHPARRALALDASFFKDMLIGLAAGHHDKAAIAQFFMDQLLKIFLVQIVPQGRAQTASTFLTFSKSLEEPSDLS